jgi:hypothetical protein
MSGVDVDEVMYSRWVPRRREGDVSDGGEFGEWM